MNTPYLLADADHTMSVVYGSLLLFGGVILYFLPSILARGKRHITGVFVLNLILGWTVIGWVVALIWSFCYERHQAGDDVAELKRRLAAMEVRQAGPRLDESTGIQLTEDLPPVGRR